MNNERAPSGEDTVQVVSKDGKARTAHGSDVRTWAGSRTEPVAPNDETRETRQ